MQQGVQFAGVLNAGYELFYTINANNSQQISNIAERYYRYEGAQLPSPPGEGSGERSEDYGYDANGNLIYVMKGTRKPDSTLVATSSRRYMWDEENRLLGINDNGFVSNYWYDASGERTVKQSYDNEGVQVNGAQSAARTGTTKFTAYISPYLVVSNGGNYTKHIYMGSQRITSKVSNSGIFTASPVKDTLQAKYATLTTKIKERFDTLGVSYKGIQQNGGLVSGNPVTTASSYFYHSDHLGSSSLITDITGALVQHVEYVPFGETFIDERNGSWHTPYLFNAKERDEETGLYYYHARYYDSKRSVWLSVDPLAEKYFWTSSYVYCLNNPIILIDPDGQGPTKPSEAINIYLGLELNSYAAGFIDGLVDASPVGLVFFVYELATSSEFRGQMLDVVMVLVNDPVGTLQTMADDKIDSYAAVFSGNATDEQKYGVANDIGVLVGAAITGGGIKKIFDKITKKSDIKAVAKSSNEAFKNRVKLRKETKQTIKDAAPKTSDGRFIDPNTGLPIEKGQEVFGHTTGNEWSKYKKDPANQGKTRKQVIQDQNNPNIYQIEDRKSNASHKYEAK